jgi:hypothetical protein
MEISPQAAAQIIQVYLGDDQIECGLGEGKDGIVFASTRNTAVKLHYRPHTYYNELAVYQRLAEQRVARVGKFSVPRLLGHDNARRLIEMSWVRPPFVLDFAGAQIDQPFDFPPEVWEHWNQQREEEYGDRWPQVLSLIHAFERHLGIYLDDISPRNVRFENEPPPPPEA